MGVERLVTVITLDITVTSHLKYSQEGENVGMKRYNPNPKADSRYFARSADRTKLVNTGMVVPRGGIRL